MLKLKLLRWVVCEGKRNLSQLSANGNELHVGVNFTTLNSSPLSLAAVREWKVWLSHSFMILTWTQGANDGFLSSRLFWICFSSSPDFINLHTMCVNRKGGETTDTFRKWIPELWLLLDLKILFLAKNIGFHSTAVGQYDKKNQIAIRQDISTISKMYDVSQYTGSLMSVKNNFFKTESKKYPILITAINSIY